MAPRTLAALSLALLGPLSAAAGVTPAEPAGVTLAAATEQEELRLFLGDESLRTATRRVTALRKAPAVAAVVTATEIRHMGARTLEDVLKTVPGFGISTNEWGSHMVEVRGIRTGTSEKILVMINGHALNRNTNGSALVYNMANRLPVENIRQIEVVRGPASALYGNSAFVATVNVITRDAEEVDGLEVEAGGGSFDTYKADLVGGKALGDKLTAFGSVDRYQSDGADLTVEADTLTGTPWSLAPASPDLGFRQTEAFLKIGYGDLSFQGHFQHKKEAFYLGIASALTDESYSNLDASFGELSYNVRLTDGLSSQVKMFYDYYEQTDSVTKIMPAGFAGGFPDGMIGDPQLKNRTLGAELQLDGDVFKDNHAIVGVTYEALRQYDVVQLANFDPATYADIGPVQEVANWNRDVTRHVFAAYLQDEWQLAARVNLTAGVRHDRYSDFGATTNPRLGLVWGLFEGADLKLLYGRAFRAPNFQELYNVNNPVVAGNPDLEPERISTWEASLAWRAGRFLAGGVTYFRSRIEDLIGWDTSTTPAVNANVGEAQTEGVELELDAAASADLTCRLSYAYQDPRDADTDRRLPYVPRQRASGRVNYAPAKYLNLHADVLWTGPRPRDAGDTRSEMPSYATVDLAVTLRNFFRTLEIQTTVRNLFDERYRDPDTSGGDVNLSGTGPKVPGDFPREGISWFTTVSYAF